MKKKYKKRKSIMPNKMIYLSNKKRKVKKSWLEKLFS